MISYLDLFNTVSNENKSLDRSMKYITDTTTADNRRIIYGTDQLISYQSLNQVLFIIYCFLLCILLFVLYYSKYVPYIKFLCFLFFLAFPFLATPVEIILYNIFNYLFTFIFIRMYPGNAFRK